MSGSVNCLIRTLCGATLLIAALSGPGFALTSWSGVLSDSAGKPVAGAVIRLHSPTERLDYSAVTSAGGVFVLGGIEAGNYQLAASTDGETWRTSRPVTIEDGLSLSAGLRISSADQQLLVIAGAEGSSQRATGGEDLSSKEVSSLPLNERDFSKLLLLAAGTMTDTNGSATSLNSLQ